MPPSAAREAVFQRGLEAYRAGLFYEAHEFWEQIWDDEEDDDHRRFLQALIQVTSALHKLHNDVAPRGALRLLDRAAGRLEGLPDTYGGVALGRFREGVVRCRAEVERLLAEGRRDLDPALVPPLDRARGPEEPASAEGPLPWRARPPEAAPDARRHLQLGVAAYRRGEYFEAHEIWEIPWRDEAHPVMKAFLQGLILVAAALHKLEKMGSAAGAARLMTNAGARLAVVPEGTGGMAIGLLRRDVERARAELERLAAEGGTRLDPVLVPRMEPTQKGVLS